MGTEKVGFSENGKNGKKGFGGADFVAEEFKGVGQGMADRPAEGAESETLQEGLRLMPDAVAAVLKIAVIKSETGIDPESGDAGCTGAVNFPLKIVAEGRGVVGGMHKIAHLANVGTLHVAKNDARPVVGDHAVKLLRGAGAGEVENRGPGLQTGAGGGGLVGLDGKEKSFGSEFAKDGKKDPGLRFSVSPGRMGEGGLGAEIHQMGALSPEAANAFKGGGCGEDNAFPVPGIGTEIHHAHQVRTFRRAERRTLQGEFPDRDRKIGGMITGQGGKRFQRKHGLKIEVFRGRAIAGMDVDQARAHRLHMPGKLMTQAELMAWEQKARRWVFVGLVGLVTGVFGFGLLTLDISYRMLKSAPVMAEALTRISGDPRVQEALGIPIRTGWAVTGEIEDLPNQGTARLDFFLRGPKGQAKVKLRAEKSPTGTWRYLLLEIQPGHTDAISCADGFSVLRAGSRVLDR